MKYIISSSETFKVYLQYIIHISDNSIQINNKFKTYIYCMWIYTLSYLIYMYIYMCIYIYIYMYIYIYTYIYLDTT